MNQEQGGEWLLENEGAQQWRKSPGKKVSDSTMEWA